jgi:hypothetical protein
VGHTGLFSVVTLMKEYILTTIPGDDFENVMPYDSRTFDSDLNDILKGIDVCIGPDQPYDQPGGRDTPTPGEKSLPIMSPSVVPIKETKPTVPLSPASLPPLPPTPPPPQSTSMHQRTKKKKKNGVARVWNKLKKLFTKKFEGDQPPPNLSDKLSPERDDGVKGYASLFSEPQKPAKAR